MNSVKLPEVTFKPFWFWSDWADVCLFDYNSCGYVLQMRRTRLNKISFRLAPMRNIPAAATCQISSVVKECIK